MTAFLAVFASVGWLAFGVMALYLSGVKRDRDKADIARKEQAKELLKEAEIDNDYRERTVARLKDLEDEIEQLEYELAVSAGPGDRRNILNRLLQKASGARRDAEHRVRKDGTAGVAGRAVFGVPRVGSLFDFEERPETD